MKKYIFTISLLFAGLLSVTNCFAQSPDFFNYQAIIRGAEGNPIANTSVDVDITIRQGSTGGTDVFTEAHTVMTNDYGLISIRIGDGTGAQYLSDIDWSSGPYFLKVDIDNTELSNTQLISVPYAKYASEAGNGVTSTQTGNWNSAYSWGNHANAGYSPSTNDFIRYNDTIYYNGGNVGIGTKDPRSTLSVYGTTANDTAIFEVKNNAGYTVFAVYNEGVRINIDEDYAAKGTKGGFAIGGFDHTKGPVQEYLRVTSDSTRIYVNENASSKGTKGGFAIGGFDMTKSGALYNYLNITPENYLIGHSAGDSLTTGKKNIMIGYETGINTTTGLMNTFLGHQAGYSNDGGNTNIFIGDNAGRSNISGFGSVMIGEQAGFSNTASRNIFIGRNAGHANITGDDNVYIGSYSGKTNTAGRHNTFLGVEAGDFSTAGSDNVYLGHRTGYFNSGSSNVVIGNLAGCNKQLYSPEPEGSFVSNVFVGSYSGHSTSTGDENVFIGRFSGRFNTTGYGNVYIGYQSGQSETTANNKLIITNNSTVAPLLEGTFHFTDANQQLLIVNGKIEMPNLSSGTGTAIYIDENGELMKLSSSKRYKNNITSITNESDIISELRAVDFKWNDISATPGESDYGLIAEEVEKIAPELVIFNKEGKPEGVSYHKVNILTLKTVQDQQKQIEELKNALINKNNQIEDLSKRLEKIEKILEKK